MVYYEYFVVYNFTDKQGRQGVGNMTIKYPYSLDSIERIRQLESDILESGKEYEYVKVFLLNFIFLKAEEVE